MQHRCKIYLYSFEIEEFRNSEDVGQGSEKYLDLTFESTEKTAELNIEKCL